VIRLENNIDMISWQYLIENHFIEWICSTIDDFVSRFSLNDPSCFPRGGRYLHRYWASSGSVTDFTGCRMRFHGRAAPRLERHKAIDNGRTKW